MFLEERQRRILEIVEERQSVKVRTLSELLSTSEVTIRRDLEDLQNQNKIVRTHGGAMLPYSVGHSIVAGMLMQKNRDIKKALAKVAYDMIEDHDTLLLDSSSTVHALIELIAMGPKSHLRVITTSISSLNTLMDCPHCSLQIVGGEINAEHKTVEGSVALRFLREIRVDKCFIGINGIDDTFGFSTPRFDDADIKNHMIQASRYSVILADHSKVGKTYLAKTDDPDCLITDVAVADFPYEAFKDLDVIFL